MRMALGRRMYNTARWSSDIQELKDAWVADAFPFTYESCWLIHVPPQLCWFNSYFVRNILYAIQYTANSNIPWQDKIYHNAILNAANPTYAGHKLSSVLWCPNLHADAPIRLDPDRQSAGSTARAENEVKTNAESGYLHTGTVVLQIRYYNVWGVWLEGHRLTTCSIPGPASVYVWLQLHARSIWMGLETVSGAS